MAGEAMNCADSCTKHCSFMVGIWGIALFIIFFLMGIGGLWNLMTGITAVDPTFDLAFTVFFLFLGGGGLLFLGYKFWSIRNTTKSKTDNLKIDKNAPLTSAKREVDKYQTTLDQDSKISFEIPESNLGNLDDPSIWKNRGNDFFKKGDFEEAIKCYAHATELNRDYKEAWNNMGLAFLKMGLTEEAKKCNLEIKRIKGVK